MSAKSVRGLVGTSVVGLQSLTVLVNVLTLPGHCLYLLPRLPYYYRRSSLEHGRHRPFSLDFSFRLRVGPFLRVRAESSYRNHDRNG